MIKIEAQFKLREPLPAYLPAGSPVSFVGPGHRELTLRGFDVRLDTDRKRYDLSTRNAPIGDGFRSRDLAFARQIVPLVPDPRRDQSVSLRRPDVFLEQHIFLPKAGDAVAISWRLLGTKITPVRLTATPIFSSTAPISREIFEFEPKQEGGRLTWMPFRRASKIIADTNGYRTDPAVTIDSDDRANATAPSAFVFELARHPALLLLGVERPMSGATDPVLAGFLAYLADPKREECEILSAA
ncbi:MAG: hypothetical protein ACREIW_12935 [Chthoniobacterales bacterium]